MIFAVAPMSIAAVATASGLGSPLGATLVTSVRQAHHAPGFAGPAQQRGQRPGTRNASAQFTSRNWDGYITYASNQGTDFNVVKATWIQPVVQCEKPNAWTVFWVGLDGWWDNTVEQGGSSAECINGTPHYTTWWEMFPTNAIQTVFAIQPGDRITASVTYKPTTKVFVINVKDVTSAKSFTQNQKCASNLTCFRSSADVIAEDVGHFGGGTYFPLANYGTMSFTGSTITDIGAHRGSFSDSAWLNAAVTESAGGITYAIVSALASGGHSFTATWKHA